MSRARKMHFFLGVLVAGAVVASSASANDRRASAGPKLVYSTYTLADASEERLAVGEDGSAYVAVGANNLDCGVPRTAGTFDTCAGQPARPFNGRGFDVLVAKFDPSGSKLVWATWLGGLTDDVPWGIAVDPGGNVYVAGFTRSNLFPTTPGAFDRKYAKSEAFVAKLDPNGSRLLYSTFLGGADDDVIHGLALDQAGNVYVAGFTASTDFPTTAGALTSSRRDKHYADAFVTKLDSSGSRLLYSTLLGGNAYDSVANIAIDRAGNAYVAGETESTNFPTTRGAPQRRCATCSPAKGGYTPDAFLAKLNPSGSRLLYGTFLGGGSVDRSYDLAIDRAGNAYVAGSTASLNFPTTRGAFDTTRNDNTVSWSDGFVTKLNRAGTRFAYSTYLGSRSDSQELVTGISVDRAGNAWVTGWTGSLRFPTTKGALLRRFVVKASHSAGSFLSKLNASGSRLSYSTFLGSALASRDALDPRGNVYVSGGAAWEIPTTSGAFVTKADGGVYGFLMKISGG
ncbi:MAG TPA: SBBP repeat-containing protein [Gaiellaceae bacterium]